MQFPCKNLEERITKNNIPMNPSERMGRQGSPFFFVECCPARFAVLRTLEMHIGFSVVTSLNSPLMEGAQACCRSATLQKQVDWRFKDSVGHLLRPLSQRGKKQAGVQLSPPVWVRSKFNSHYYQSTPKYWHHAQLPAFPRCSQRLECILVSFQQLHPRALFPPTNLQKPVCSALSLKKDGIFLSPWCCG